MYGHSTSLLTYPLHQRILAMSRLLTLPPELLMQIFAASDTILDALHLSATNRFLAAIWLEHSAQIIESILKRSIPAYNEAVTLAFLETRLQSSIAARLSLRRCLPLISRNGDLCASVCLAYSAVCEDNDTTTLPESYYLLHRIGLESLHHQLRDNLYLELRAMSKEAPISPIGFGRWVWDHASWEEKVRQSVPEEWQRDQKDVHCDWETTWDYADYVLTGPVDDIGIVWQSWWRDTIRGKRMCSSNTSPTRRSCFDQGP
jgi:hypothetical protein